MADKLTVKQEKFIAAYIGDCNGNGVKAARAAGYAGSDATLRVIGADNLTKPSIAAAIAEYKATLRQQGIASLEMRIKAQDDRWERMRAVIAARAADDSLDAPGAKTGLLTRTFKALGHGDNFRVVEEYEVDTGLLAELRALEQHTAKELGQWVDHSAVEIDLDACSNEELEAIARGESPRGA